MVPWEVVGDQIVKKVLSDGSWARLSRVVSSDGFVTEFGSKWNHWSVKLSDAT